MFRSFKKLLGGSRAATTGDTEVSSAQMDRSRQGISQRMQDRRDALKVAREPFVDQIAKHLEEGAHVEILDRIFPLDVCETLPSDTVFKLLRNAGEPFCSDLFQALNALRKQYDWCATVGKKGAGGWDGFLSPETTMFRHGEDVLFALCEVGFTPKPSWAKDILHFVSQAQEYQAPYGLISEYRKMTVLRSLAKLFPTHQDLPEDARPFAIAIAQSTFQSNSGSMKSPLSPGGKILPKHKAMMQLAGTEEDNFLDKMRKLPAPRIGHPDPNGNYRMWLADFRKVQDRLKILVSEFKDTHGKPAWWRDETAYTATFGTTDDEQEKFGWWLRPHPQGAGCAILSAETYERMIAPNAYDDMYDWVGALETLLAQDTDTLPFSFGSDAVPDIELFTFGGADPDGQLLAHLATATTAKPTAAWRKTAREHIYRIGPDVVFSGFRTWLGYAVELDDAFFETLLIGDVPAAARRLAGGGWSAAETPISERNQGKVDTTILNRAALVIMRMPAYVNEEQARRQWQHSGHSEKMQHRGEISHVNVCIMTGIFWAMENWPEGASLESIEKAGTFCFQKNFGAFRSRKAGNAALWVLGQIGTRDAVHMLARLRRTVARDKAVSKQIDKALTETGQQVGLDLDDMKELSADDWGITNAGLRIERLGDCRVTLRVVSSRRVTLESQPWDDANAPSKRGIIKAAIVDQKDKELAAELKKAATDIPTLLAEARQRFVAAMRNERSWAWSDFHERFLVNELVATLTRRIIWQITQSDGTSVEALYDGRDFCDVAGNRIGTLLDTARIAVWHPLSPGTTDAIDWADRLAALDIRQPFAQAWRTIYRLTPPEEETRTYSNRFAGHILHQPTFVAMLRKRGWNAGSKMGTGQDDLKARNWLDFPTHHIRAEYWVAGVGAAEYTNHEYGADNYEFVATDRVQFFAIDDAGHLSKKPMKLEDVPPRAFSEALTDIEVVVGATSIGRDHHWEDLGENTSHPANFPPDSLSYRDAFAVSGSKEAIALRRTVLERLLPKLAIAPVTTLENDWLLVVGNTGNRYQIHLGSAAITLSKRNQHICIVPKKDSDPNRPMLPFEGDATFSEILSKAVMLSNDDKIKNPDIRKQIGI
ncbi:DUF4132 domain-containing protein [Yoonia maritima]|uniref:DUF4132 domain-containing protein n=1 Tax=Yoonia maritima TaxID=1435347 RepID=UPI0037352ABB